MKKASDKLGMTFAGFLMAFVVLWGLHLGLVLTFVIAIIFTVASAGCTELGFQVHKLWQTMKENQPKPTLLERKHAEFEALYGTEEDERNSRMLEKAVGLRFDKEGLMLDGYLEPQQEQEEVLREVDRLNLAASAMQAEIQHTDIDAEIHRLRGEYSEMLRAYEDEDTTERLLIVNHLKYIDSRIQKLEYDKTRLTMEQVKTMTPDEINARWQEVQEAMANQDVNAT